MSEAIALSSPSGKMSKRARKRAEERLRVALFGPNGLQKPPPKQWERKELLLHRARELRELAARGMKPRAYKRKAEELEREAAGYQRLAHEGIKR